jgi:hypothetical protein
MTVKTSGLQRAMDAAAVRTRTVSNRRVREQIPLSDLPDCLLAAYDGVSHRAFERFVERGSTPGNEMADWRAAENDLFLPVEVDFEDTEHTLYALATLEGLMGSQVLVAIEERWLLISGHLRTVVASQDNANQPSNQRSRYFEPEWIQVDELHRILKASVDYDAAGCLPSEESATSRMNSEGARPFCVVELPVDVDAGQTVAVLSHGLIAIRMPKMRVQNKPDK